MKKITTFVFLLFLTFSSYSQQINAIPSLWESSVTNGAGGWNLIASVAYTFDSNCLPTEIESTVNGTKASLSITSYDSNSIATETITQIWNGGSWENSIKSTFTYTGNLITELTNYKWDSGGWVEDIRTLNTYNGSDMVIVNLSQSWIAGDWVDTLKTETTYTENDLLDVVTSYTWVDPSWEELSRVTHGYNGANFLITLETSSWSGSDWQNDSLDNYTYDGSNFVIEILGTTWNGSSYDDNSLSTITNNVDGYPIDTINQTWIAFVGWFDSSRVEIQYNQCATLANEDYEEIFTEVYPNPATDQVNIIFKDSFEGRISIFDTQGRSIYTIPYENLENNIDLSQLSGGVYFLVAESDNKRTVKRIIVEK